MKRTLTANDIVNSVEFELLQGALSQDELGAGLQNLRSYQHKAHSALYDPARSHAPAFDDLAELQLQLNDSLLSLIEVLGRRVDAARLEARRVGALVEQVDLPQLAATWREATPLPMEGGGILPGDHYVTSRGTPPLENSPAPFAQNSGTELQPLAIEMDVRPVRVPLIGGMLTRLRTAVHELVLFYVRQLAQQQNQANAAYAAQLTQLAATVQSQDAELRSLYASVEQVGPTAAQAGLASGLEAA